MSAIERILTPRRCIAVLGISFLAACTIFLTVILKFFPEKVTFDPAVFEPAAGLSFAVDSVKESLFGLEVSGWILKRGWEDDAVCGIRKSVILRTEDGICYTVPTRRIQRSDVTRHFSKDRKNYSLSGFWANSLLLWPRQRFEICLLWQDGSETHLVRTGVLTKFRGELSEK